jgi:hypothetical protein
MEINPSGVETRSAGEGHNPVGDLCKKVEATPRRFRDAPVSCGKRHSSGDEGVAATPFAEISVGVDVISFVIPG